MSDYTNLKVLIAKIDANLRAAETARNLPNARAHSVRSMRVIATRYDSSNLDDAQKIIAARMLETAEAEERAAGAIARDRELKRLAVELDELRSDLVVFAGRARFELCDRAREMRAGGAS